MVYLTKPSSFVKLARQIDGSVGTVQRELALLADKLAIKCFIVPTQGI
jgi:hypothetical protein